MISDIHSEALEVRKEGRGLCQGSNSTGSALILPSVYKTMRYYEIKIVRNKGGIYVGWMEDAKSRSYPFSTSTAVAPIGSLAGTFAVNSQTGSVGHANVWKPYFGRKIRKGDTIGTIIDLTTGTIRFLLRSVASRRLPDVFGSVAFTVDVNKVYHASISLKYALTQVEGQFTHPFALWDMVEAHFGTRDLFAALSPMPFRLVTPIYNSALPLPLSSVSTAQNMKALQSALERFETNTTHSLLLSLPFETILHILSFIDVLDVPATAAVCHAFYESIAHYRFWNELIERDFHFGFGISTQLYFDKLAQNPDTFGSVADVTLDDHHFRNPYAVDCKATASKLAKDRYRKRYHWAHGHYDPLTSIPTECSVKAMAYDEAHRVLFFSEEENFWSYSFDSGDVSQGLMSTVGHISSMQCKFGLLFMATDHGFVHVLDAVSGAQIARFSDDAIRTLDAHYDEQSKTLLILTGTKHKAVKLWRLDGVHSRLNRRAPEKFKRSKNLYDSTESINDSSEDDSDSEFGEESRVAQDPDEEFETAHNNNTSSLIVPRLVWKSVKSHQTTLVTVSFVPETQGRQFLSASADGKIHAWRLKTSFRFDNTLSNVSPRPLDESMAKLELTEPEGAALGEHEMDEETYLSLRTPPEFELDYGINPLYTWTMVCESPLTALKCMDISPEGWFAAVGASSGEMFVFDARDGSAATSLPVTMLGGGSGAGGRVVGGGAQAPARLPHQARAILHLHYECGGKLVTVQEDNSVRMWNQATGLPRWKHQTPGLAGSLLCTEDFLAFGLFNGRVAILDFDQVELSEVRLKNSLNKRKDYLYRMGRHSPSK